MKTRSRSSNSRKTPPLAALLLVLAVFFSVAAWRVSEINQNQTPHEPSTRDAVPTARSASPQASIHGGYRAHRHQAVSLGEGAALARANRGGVGSGSMHAVL